MVTAGGEFCGKLPSGISSFMGRTTKYPPLIKSSILPPGQRRSLRLQIEGCTVYMFWIILFAYSLITL